MSVVVVWWIPTIDVTGRRVKHLSHPPRLLHADSAPPQKTRQRLVRALQPLNATRRPLFRTLQPSPLRSASPELPNPTQLSSHTSVRTIHRHHQVAITASLTSTPTVFLRPTYLSEQLPLVFFLVSHKRQSDHSSDNMMPTWPTASPPQGVPPSTAYAATYSGMWPTPLDPLSSSESLADFFPYSSCFHPSPSPTNLRPVLFRPTSLLSHHTSLRPSPIPSTCPS